jgi:hypothetical protein
MMKGERKSSANIDNNTVLALNLWRWGLPVAAIVALIVSLAHILSMFQIGGINIIADKSDGALKYLGFAVLALVIIRAGALLKAKFAGIELEFASSIADHANHQEANIQQMKTEIIDLKRRFAQFQGADFTAVDASKEGIGPQSGDEHQMPELGPVTVINDKNKGRFGSSPNRNGFRLGADFRFRNYDDPLITVVLRVFRDDNEPMNRAVRFFVHETFGTRKEIAVSPSEGKISIELLVYGGFTVGAWVVGTDTLLELDLAEQQNAPSVIRNK